MGSDTVQSSKDKLMFQMHNTEFNSLAALAELYNYSFKYSDQLILTLEEDEFSTKNRLAYRLEQVHNIMTTDHD